jgi:hypothetical protein
LKGFPPAGEPEGDSPGVFGTFGEGTPGNPVCPGAGEAAGGLFLAQLTAMLPIITSASSSAKILDLLFIVFSPLCFFPRGLLSECF